MKKLLMLILFVLISTMLYGCSGSSSSNRAVAKPDVISVNKSEAVDAAVYLDGTFSMAGYVNYPNTTVYSDALKNIERTVTGTWKRENIQYIKFGDSLQNLSREQFLQSNNVAFYQEKDTSLQTVVDSMDANKLNILVTDLFQTNQDIDSLIISLKKACFADGSKAMALIGVKSQFNGKIYDVGKNGLAFTYTSKEEVETYRPFYLLVLGKDADVRAFTENYTKHFDDEKLVKMTLFSKNIGTDVVLTAGKAVKKDKEEKFSNMAQISTLLGSNSDILQYRLKLGEKQSGFYATLQAKNVIGNCPDDFKKFAYNVEKWEQADGTKEAGFMDKVMGKSQKNAVAGKFTEVNAKNFIEAKGSGTGLHGTDANVNLLFKFDPAAIKKTEGKYRVNLALIPAKDEYIASNEVFKDWNFDDTAAVSAEALAVCGGKTLNIDGFVKTVASLNYEMNKPGFYNVCVYLEAIK